MLGILLLYFIGKFYYQLADDFKKSPWVYAIAGIISYYVGTIVGGVLLAIFAGIDLEEDKLVAAFLVLPFGLLSCVTVYVFLKNRWTKKYGAPKKDYYRE